MAKVNTPRDRRIGGGFVDQQFLNDPAAGVVGDCWRACIASLLAHPREDVPHFVAMIETEDDFLARTQHWLRWHYGAELHYHKPEFPIYETFNPHVIVVGLSPRGTEHAILADAKTGAMVHDPHPSRAGLVEIYSVFALSDPWPICSERSGSI